MFRKTAVLGSFGHIRTTFGNRMWPKLPKGTTTRQDLSFARTPTSIRQFVTKKQPGKAHVSKKNVVLGSFGHIRSTFGNRMYSCNMSCSAMSQFFQYDAKKCDVDFHC